VYAAKRASIYLYSKWKQTNVTYKNIAKQFNLSGDLRKNKGFNKDGCFSLEQIGVGKYFCTTCRKNIKHKPRLLVIYHLIRKGGCIDYSHVIGGNLYDCKMPLHIKSTPIESKYLAAIVCSNECYNLFLFQKGVE
jgi:hypothetical protein